jgi:hypothetical protein
MNIVPRPGLYSMSHPVILMEGRSRLIQNRIAIDHSSRTTFRRTFASASVVWRKIRFGPQYYCRGWGYSFYRRCGGPQDHRNINVIVCIYLEIRYHWTVVVCPLTIALAYSIRMESRIPLPLPFTFIWARINDYILNVMVTFDLCIAGKK